MKMLEKQKKYIRNFNLKYTIPGGEIVLAAQRKESKKIQ